MKLNSKTDINATLNATFAGLADFDSFERQVRHSGAEISRVDDLSQPGPGMMWAVRAEFRGKLQKITLELVDYDPPNSMLFHAATDGFEADIKAELIALSSRETRMPVSVEIKAKSLAARLILQSARLTKSSILKRYRKGLNRFGNDLENRIKKA